MSRTIPVVATMAVIGVGVGVYAYFRSKSLNDPEIPIESDGDSGPPTQKKSVKFCPQPLPEDVSSLLLKRLSSKTSNKVKIGEITLDLGTEETSSGGLSSSISHTSTTSDTVLKSSKPSVISLDVSEASPPTLPDKVKIHGKTSKCKLCCKGHFMHIDLPNSQESVLCMTFACPNCKRMWMLNEKETHQSAAEAFYNLTKPHRKKQESGTSYNSEETVKNTNMFMYQLCSHCCKKIDGACHSSKKK